uniref:DNA mismatch repair protein n=1 Tax=Ditylenchus dipsaci TaxID=166011 RepID=A0A915EKT9_9BILA
MSATRKPSAKQTSLTSFFQKGPKPITQFKSRERNIRHCKREIDSDDDESVKGTVKRRRVIVSSDDEDDLHKQRSNQRVEQTKLEPEQPIRQRTPLMKKQKYVLTETPSLSTPRRNLMSESHAELYISAYEFDESLDTTNDFSQLSNTTAATPSVSKGRSKEKNNPTEADFSMERFPHLEFEFLKSEKIVDANKRRPDHPDYDPKTIHVPEEFLKKQTPAHQQWWKFKMTNFDSILFFKVGKFYELFHMDAVTAVANMDLNFMGQNKEPGPKILLHIVASPKAVLFSKFFSVGRYSDQLISRGFKVARVEQTESKKDADDRILKTKCKDKVVRREICRVTTSSTRSYGVLEGTNDRETDGLNDSEPKYLLAIAEKLGDDSLPSYGICFVDCATAKFHLSEFKDDRHKSSLRTLLANVMPVEILFEKNNLSPATTLLLTTTLSGVPKQHDILIEALRCVGHCCFVGTAPEKEFLTAQKTISLLRQDDYLGVNVNNWPDVLKSSLDDLDSPMPKPQEGCSLLFSSMGAVIWFLKSCLIDTDMVTMRQFGKFLPTNLLNQGLSRQVGSLGRKFWIGRHMVLDGVSLLNLHVLPPFSAGSHRQAGFKSRNPSDVSSSKNSLFSTINRCVTPFGKRLLQQWVCAPTCDPDTIEDRQQAVQTLMRANAFVSRAVDKMRLIPDLERLFQRVHTIGLKRKDHPDDRAQFFESNNYNQRKIKDLVITLDGIEAVRQLRLLFNEEGFGGRSKLLDKCLGEDFPAMEADLAHFKKAFNRSLALCNGVIEPNAGIDVDYDKAVAGINASQRELQKYLETQKSKFKCQEIKYFGTGKNRYQLEIPEKGFKRFYTDRLIALIAELTETEVTLKTITDDLTRRVFADFDRRKNSWAGIVKNVAIFDCVLSLCRYSQTSGVNMCFPEIDFESKEPYLDIRSGQHPCLISNASGSRRVGNHINDIDYIPNDCTLGAEGEPLVILLTGPNMGGKLDLWIGANDSLSAGQSTFFVELAETNVILKEATPHSLVLIDELGRGTSTFDGTAIACATLKYIADKIRCPTLFSTHYHALCDMVEGNNNIKLAHMACVAEKENTEDPTEENITFLYTLTPGPCLKSYGFYTAKIAGISTEVVRRAFSASRFLEIEE